VNTLYSHAIRVLACQSCGAPFDAAIAGGQAKCSYCSAINVVTRRDERSDLSRAQEALGAAMSESERFAQLRHQNQGPENLPASLAAWLSGRTLNRAFLPQAQQDWQMGRQELAAGSGAFSVAERFFWLSVLIVDHVEPRRQRATLETAAELLTDTRHRHVVRCMLARRAAQHGDAQAAVDWLATCNPRSTDLITDTAFRYASATLAASRNDPVKIFEWLGHRPGDVPLADRQQFACELLRVHALELSGRGAEAATDLRVWIARFGAEAVQGAIRNHAPLELCPNAMAQALRDTSNAKDEAQLTRLGAERAQLRLGLAALLPSLRRLPFLVLLLMVPMMVIRCAGDADPLAGSFGYALCPAVCDDCAGPTRTVTVWHQTGPGEWTTDGAWFFCQTPDMPLRDMSAAELEVRARDLGRAQLSGFAANGATFLMLLLLAFPGALISGVRAGMRNAKKAEPIDAQVAALAQRLGRAPPEPDKTMFLMRLPGALTPVAVCVGVALLMIAAGLLV